MPFLFESMTRSWPEKLPLFIDEVHNSKNTFNTSDHMLRLAPTASIEGHPILEFVAAGFSKPCGATNRQKGLESYLIALGTTLSFCQLHFHHFIPTQNCPGFLLSYVLHKNKDSTLSRHKTHQTLPPRTTKIAYQPTKLRHAQRNNVYFGGLPEQARVVATHFAHRATRLQ